jgi:hypothetical protein
MKDKPNDYTPSDRENDDERDRRVRYINRHYKRYREQLKDVVYKNIRDNSYDLSRDIVDCAGNDDLSLSCISAFLDDAFNTVIESIDWQDLGECGRGDCNAYYDRDKYDDSGFCSEDCEDRHNYDKGFNETKADDERRGIK